MVFCYYYRHDSSINHLMTHRPVIRILLGLFIIANITAIVSVGGACEPYIADPALLEGLTKDEFIKQLFPIQSPEQKQRMNALASAPLKTPAQIAELANIEMMWKLTREGPLPVPFIAPIPFGVGMNPPNLGSDRLVKIEFDLNGDGKPDLVWNRYEASKPPFFT